MGVADWENRIFRIVVDWLQRFIDAVRRAVMRPFREYQAAPDPSGVYMNTLLWTQGVDAITEALVPVMMESYDNLLRDHNPGQKELVTSTEAFARTQLAETKNLLARIPDEIYNLVFAELTEGINEGEHIPELAARIDRVLETSGSERWKNRARVIAITETNRAYNAGAYAAALRSQQLERTTLYKQWIASRDERTRPTHRAADGQRVPVSQPFIVGDSPLMFPGDPTGPPDEVINCRCSLSVKDEA